MASRFNTPWNKTTDFFLDVEATGLPFKHFFTKRHENGQMKLPTLPEVGEAYDPLTLTQFGYVKGDKLRHISILDTDSGYIPHVEGEFNVNTVFKGQRVKAVGHSITKHSIEDIQNFLKKSGKLTPAQIDYYMKNIAPVVSAKSIDTMYKIDLGDDRQLYTSKWAKKKFFEGTEAEIEAQLKKYGIEGSEYVTKPMSVFYNSKEKDSLYQIMDDILTESARTPVGMGAWNAQYDVNFIRNVLQRSGHIDLLQRFEEAVQTGNLQMHSLEREWQMIAYKLVEENPELADSFRIGYFPEAFAETGGRFGSVARSFEEFQYSSLKWSANDVARYFSWHKGVYDALGGKEEAHLAGADVKLEKAIAEALEEIKAEAHGLAAARGLSFSSFEEFIKSKGNGKIMEDAMQAVMARHLSAQANRKISMHSVDILKKVVAREAKSTADFNSKLFPSFLRGGPGNPTNWKKYGGMAAALATIAAITYIGKKDDDYKDSGGSVKGFTTNRKLTTTVYDKYSEEGNKANLKGGFLNTVLPNVALTVAGLAAVGLSATYTHPIHIFGTKRNIEKSFKDITKNFLRTARYGLRRVEANIPLARVFKAGATLDYLLGTKRVGVMTNRAGQEFYKGVSIPIIRENSYVYKASRDNLSALLEAAEHTNPNEAQMIKDFIQPTRLGLHIDRATLRISTTKEGKTIVFFDQFDAAGQKISVGQQSVLLDIEGHISKTRMRNPLERNMGKSAAMYAKDMKPIFNPVLGNKYAEDAVRRYGMEKIPLSDFMRRKIRPAFAQSGTFLGTMWEWTQKAKYHLDLVPKGVGEGENLLRPDLAKQMHELKSYFVVTGLSGAHKNTKLDFLTKWDFHKHWIREHFTLHTRLNVFLETPFEQFGLGPTIRNMIETGEKSRNKLANLGAKALGFIERPHLGLDIHGMKHGLPEYLVQLGVKRILPAYAAYVGIQAIDHAIGKLTFSPTGRGPLGFITHPFKTASLAYSKVSDIFGMTNVAKRQEKVAPGSTGLGILAPALTLWSVGYTAELAHRYGPSSLRNAMNTAGEKLAQNRFISQALRKESWRGSIPNRTSTERFFSWMLNNPKKALFAAGLIPMLPFLPGALGSNKSYAERKAEYEGKKEVPIRKARGWLWSSSPLAGGKVLHWRRHGINLYESDWENRGVVWPSYGSKFLHNISFGLLGRYKLEEYHAKDQPVYQSGSYGANVPVIGGLIAATIGRLIKPVRTYHLPQEGLRPQDPHSEESTKIAGSSGSLTEYADAYLKLNNNVSMTNQLAEGYIKQGTVVTPGDNMQMQSGAGIGKNLATFQSSYYEAAGFMGFFSGAMQGIISGKRRPDEFTPYAQSATQMYNPAKKMWQYNLGDPTIFGGEFLRRVFQNPAKSWEENNIPNELYGQGWIPHDKEVGNDYWHGTTFDKTPMGWLYGSRKGWEFLYPTMTDVPLENYPSQIKLEVLKHIGPYSREFSTMSQKVSKMALANQLDPYQENRYYETVDQVRQVREKVRAHAAKYTFEVPTEVMSGKLTGVDVDTGEFTVDTAEGRTFRLAGISTNMQDIRRRLLQSNVYESAQEVDQNAQAIQQNIHKIILEKMQVGEAISFSMPDDTSFSGSGKVTEAIVGSLNDTLLKAGAPFADTGSLSSFNMAQKQVGAIARAQARYWDTMTGGESFWNRKLVADRDYLSTYKNTQVYNKEIKLWTRPIEHILKPMVSTMLRHFGIDKIPTFTLERRKRQQYWDVVKYVKYKALAVQAAQEGNADQAKYYHSKWRQTMVGANPMDEKNQDEYMALPENERPYYRFFANEPSAKKRGEILKTIPSAARRIYEGTWLREIAKHSRDEEVLNQFQKLKESEGYVLSEKEEKQWMEETDGKTSKADWARARFVDAYAAKHALPGLDWQGWSADVNLENVEINSIRGQGEQTEDYGFFDTKVRQAVYDNPSYGAALDINSLITTDNSFTGEIVPFIAQGDGVEGAFGMPTSSQNPIMSTRIKTNGYMKTVERSNDPNNELVHPHFYSPSSYLDRW